MVCSCGSWIADEATTGESVCCGRPATAHDDTAHQRGPDISAGQQVTAHEERGLVLLPAGLEQLRVALPERSGNLLHGADVRHGNSDLPFGVRQIPWGNGFSVAAQ